MPALSLLLAIVLLALPSAAAEPARYGTHSSTEGPLYRIGSVELTYARPHPEHPAIRELADSDFALGQAEDGLVGPRIGGRNLWFRLSEIALGDPIDVYSSGLRELAEQLVGELNARGLLGVFVAPHEADIDARTGVDQRPAGHDALRLVIYTGRVEGLRSFAAGAGGAEAAVDQDRHARIRSGSPVTPGDDAAGSLLLKRDLDEYLAYLNRHPGRRVDLAVTPSREPGGVYLDYVIAEDRPWLLYSQLSDTGTDSTGEWRQRFGFAHYQLTGRDDVLELDYVTSEFDEIHAARAAYELPLWGVPRTRLGVAWSGSRYEASQLGFGDDAFEGQQWSVSAELRHAWLQSEEMFVDLVAGARWLDVEVDNLGVDGDSDFLLPRLGVRVEQQTSTSSLRAGLHFERSVSSGADSESELFNLGGRSDLDDTWNVLGFDGRLAFYLEPLLNGRAWRNPRTPASSTLAHEVLLRARGQLALGNRLIPQAQQTLGGLHSVRGYEQSIVSGDSVYFVSAEYRFHLPRAFDLEPDGRRLPLLGLFHVAPQRVYARPDWDLVLRAFLDVGRTLITDAIQGEDDNTLAGIGIGLELSVRRNLSLRWDLARALRDVEVGGSRRADSGDVENYFSATVRY